MIPLRPFTASIILHAAVAAAVVWMMTRPHVEEPEEELVLELSLAAPAPTKRAVQPRPITPATPIPQTARPVSAVPAPPSPADPQPTPAPTSAPPQPSEMPIPDSPVLPVAETAPAPIPAPDPQPVSVPVDPEAQYLDDHLAAIRELLIRYRKYPLRAIRFKQEGTVRVSFRLTRTGEIEELSIVGSSGHAVLDDAAMELIRTTADYFPKPPKPVRITIPLSYRLS